MLATTPRTTLIGGAIAAVAAALLACSPAAPRSAAAPPSTLESPSNIQLRVTFQRGPKGHVASTPAGIDCGRRCFSSYPAGTLIRLEVTSDHPTLEATWGSVCAPGPTCSFRLDRATKVVLGFRPTPLRETWSARLHCTGKLRARSVEVDDHGDVYVAGLFEGTLSVDGLEYTSSGLDGFVAKLSGDTGELTWFVPFGGSSSDSVGAIATNHSQELFVTGSVSDTSRPGDNRSGRPEIFVAKLAQDDGGKIWYRIFPGGYAKNGGNNGGAIAVDHDGNLRVSVGFSGDLTIAQRTLVATNTPDFALLNVRGEDGEPVWATSLSQVTVTKQPLKIALDPAGNAYLAGRQWPPRGVGPSGPLVMKFSPTGDELWSVVHPSDGFSGAIDIAMVGRLLLVGGAFQERLRTPVRVLSIKPRTDAGFLLAMGPDGATRWVVSRAGSDRVLLTGLAVEPDGILSALVADKQNDKLALHRLSASRELLDSIPLGDEPAFSFTVSSRGRVLATAVSFLPSYHRGSKSASEQANYERGNYVEVRRFSR